MANSQSRLFDRVSKMLKKSRAGNMVEEAVFSPLEPAVTRGDSKPGSAKSYVPMGIQATAAWSWRLIAIAIAAFGLLWIMSYLTMVIIPVSIAMLFTAVLNPMVNILSTKLRFPRALAALLAMLLGITIFTLIISLAVSQIVTDAPNLAAKLTAAFEQLRIWLAEGPISLRENQLDAFLTQASVKVQSVLRSNVSSIANGAFWAASSLGTFLTLGLSTIFCIFFFLHDGRAIWLWVVRIMPRISRRKIHESVTQGWSTLGSWARVQFLVAAIDAVGIGAGAYFLGVGLWAPIGLLTFLAAFIPIVGAIMAGVVATLVALVDVGAGSALIMMIIVLVVQQLEGNVLQPILMASAVSLHPVAVLLGVTAGGYLLGILGALFTVPVMAFVNAACVYATSSYSLQNRSHTSDRELGMYTSGDELVDALQSKDSDPRDAFSEEGLSTDDADDADDTAQDSAQDSAQDTEKDTGHKTAQNNASLDDAQSSVSLDSQKSEGNK